ARGSQIAERLDELTAQMGDHLDAGDVTGFTEADRTFHEVIVGAADNEVLTRLYRSLRERQVCINAAAMRVSTERMEAALADHQRLAELVRGDDEAAFCQLCEAHLERARENISPAGDRP